MPVQLSQQVLGRNPIFFPKTDETRVQAAPRVLEEIFRIPCYVTEKVDGTSISVWNYEGFGVGSRNYSLKPGEGGIYWEAVLNKYLDKTLPEGLCIQGELMGPGIQGNKYGLPGHRIFWYSGYNIPGHCYLDYYELKNLCQKLGLITVPLISFIALSKYSVDEMVEMAKGVSALAPIQREGIVIRALKNEISDALDSRLSFKVINPAFLLKYDE
jgi:RNA ligase (TIGR02306 family)